jgi:hypothetical protein
VANIQKNCKKNNILVDFFVLGAKKTIVPQLFMVVALFF